MDVLSNSLGRTIPAIMGATVTSLNLSLSARQLTLNPGFHCINLAWLLHLNAQTWAKVYVSDQDGIRGPRAGKSKMPGIGVAIRFKAFLEKIRHEPGRE